MDNFMREETFARERVEQMAPAEAEHHRAAKAMGRIIGLAIVLIGALVIAVGLTACSDDDDEPGYDWYLSGVWENNSYPDENMVFYNDGTGYWESEARESYLDFDYYCFGDWIYFTFYPVGAPSYELDCTIDMINSGNLSITWPAGSFYGPVTIYYTRMD